MLIDGMSLRSLWTPGAFSDYHDVLCDNQDLTRRIDVSHNIPTSLFQDLHSLSPKHQTTLLDLILCATGPSRSTEEHPLFITITSIPTATLVSRLRQFSWPGVYYVNLDGMKADVSILEQTLSNHIYPHIPPLKIPKLAQILAASPKPARHLKRLLGHWRQGRDGWDDRLDLVLAAPESEAWRLIEEHFGVISKARG